MLDLGTSFVASVARDPEALAIVDGDLRLTYSAWYRRISALIAGFDAFGLAPLDPNAVKSQVAPLKTADITFSTTDIAGDKTRTIAAWTRRDGRVWFFKATGPNAAVEQEKPNFVKFIESVRF